MGIRHVRRIPHPSRGGARTRRSNMGFHSSVGGGGGVTTGGGAGGGGVAPPSSNAASSLAALAPSSRDTMDPIAGG